MPKSALVLKDIDQDLYHRFKVACLQERHTLRAVILWFMRDFADNPQDYLIEDIERRE